MLGVHPSPRLAVAMMLLNSMRTLGGSVGEPTALVKHEVVGVVPQVRGEFHLRLLVVTSAFEGVEDDGWCVEGADGFGGLGGADGDGAAVAFASFADVDDVVVEVDVVPGDGGFAWS
jgi:hypothetical protein